ncbi:hypothetical protein C7271_17165 [filamentous cyanobacterium CCP5]|nr:hypothetical protein C7271_17165 [filamentous cyanobacterium CCP5]
MVLNLTLPRYQVKRVRRNRTYLYEIEGEDCCYPGVTKILSATKPAEARQALWRWQQSVGVEAARQITNKASSAGTRLHKQIAAHLNGEAVDIPADISGYWDSILPVLDQVEAVLLVEGSVWHADGFVGFPDALIIYDDQVCLCDWKTARKPKQRDWIEDYFLQIAAYRVAAQQVYAELGLVVNRGLVAIALDDQPAQRFELSEPEMEDYWHQFQQRLTQYHSHWNR